MSYYNKQSACLECESGIEHAVHNYSTQNYGYSLCRKCQLWFQTVIEYTTATDNSIKLYFALKKLGVPAILEDHDGYKTVDISVPDAKVHIEVDGKQHVYNSKQALQDLKRTVHALRDGYNTLRVPNVLIEKNLDEAAKFVTDYLIQNRDSKKSTSKLQDDNFEEPGFCIRCEEEIEFNPDKPLCYECYSIWTRHNNKNYEENFCHSCGEEESTSMNKPLCWDCFANGD